MSHRPLRIVVLARESESTRMLVHALQGEHTVTRSIIEDEEDHFAFLKRRVKRLGWITVIGQVLFMAFVPPVLSFLSRGRTREIKRSYGLVTERARDVPVTRVHSVNSEETIKALCAEAPDAVVVHGTRIIASTVLSSVSAPFYNIHAGITPLYRGVHGGYWALSEGRPDLFGATVHRVDEGIDTGGALAYAYVRPTSRDSFVTYPLLQLGEGIRALLIVLRGGVTTPQTPSGRSKIWYHPTLWGYLATYLTHGVR